MAVAARNTRLATRSLVSGQYSYTSHRTDNRAMPAQSRTGTHTIMQMMMMPARIIRHQSQIAGAATSCKNVGSGQGSVCYPTTTGSNTDHPVRRSEERRVGKE